MDSLPIYTPAGATSKGDDNISAYGVTRSTVKDTPLSNDELDKVTITHAPIHHTCSA